MKHLSTTAAILLLQAAFTSAAPAKRASNSTYQIQWAPCPNITGLDCGELQVPIDWNNTGGDQVTLVLQRINATNPSARIGSLIFNPGGPGVAATTVCQGQAYGLPFFGNATLEHFDIICPDPRGVGLSSPIVCDPQTWNNNVSLFPSNATSLGQLVAANKARGQSCLNATGSLLAHIDQVSVAKDIEAIRIALNDGKLNYLGLSYGTVLGATYAELFPQNIRAMSLDGAVNHAQSNTDLINTESEAYQNVLDIFFDWCAQNATACGGFQGSNLPKMFDDLVANATKSPIPASGCSGRTCKSTVSGEDIILNTQNLLLFKSDLFGGILPGWEALGQALNTSITKNDATAFSTQLATSNTSGLFPATAISCLDFNRPNVTNLTTAAGQFTTWQIMGNAFNSHIGAASQSYSTVATCVGWPVQPVDPQHNLNQTALAMAPPILITNANHDPSTSYAWANGVQHQIPSSVLLTRNGDGHTSYFLGGATAAAIDTYLVNLTLPAPGTIVNS